MRSWWLCVSLALVLAGCSEAPASNVQESQVEDPVTEDKDDVVELVELGPPSRARLYFTSTGQLAWTPPAPGSVPIGTASTGFFTGVTPVQFDLPAPGHPMLIAAETANVVAMVTSSLPQASNHMFDTAAWLGSTVGNGLFGYTTSGTMVPPGETQEVRIDLPFGSRRPIFIPAGESVRILMTGPFGGETGQPHLVVGGESPSYLDLTLRNYTADPVPPGVPTTSTLSGSLAQAYVPVDCDLAPGTTSAQHTVPVHANTTMLRLDLTSRSAAFPRADADLQLMDSSTLIAATATPYAEETILLAADSLQGLPGKDLTVLVYLCGPGPADYTIDVTQSLT